MGLIFETVDSTLSDKKVVKGLGIFLSLPEDYAYEVEAVLERAYSKGYSRCKRELRDFLGVEEELESLRGDIQEVKRW